MASQPKRGLRATELVWRRRSLPSYSSEKAVGQLCRGTQIGRRGRLCSCAVTLFVPDDMICKAGKGQQELVLKGRSGTSPGILGLGSHWLRPDVQIGHAGKGNPAQTQLSCEHSSNDNQNKPQLGSGSGKNLNHVISTV